MLLSSCIQISCTSCIRISINASRNVYMALLSRLVSSPTYNKLSRVDNVHNLDPGFCRSLLAANKLFMPPPQMAPTQKQVAIITEQQCGTRNLR